MAGLELVEDGSRPGCTGADTVYQNRYQGCNPSQRPWQSILVNQVHEYTERLAEAEMAASVGSVGDSYDNVLAETINGLYKTELIRMQGPWHDLEAVEYGTLKWVDWFNNKRLLEPIGNMPPVEFEQAYYEQLNRHAEAA